MTTEPTADAPAHEPQDGLCDLLRHHVRTSEHFQAEATDDSDFYVGAIAAFSRAAADADPWEERRIAAERLLARIRHALAIPDDADLVDRLKDLYAQWEQAENEVARLTVGIRALARDYSSRQPGRYEGWDHGYITACKFAAKDLQSLLTPSQPRAETMEERPPEPPAILS